MQPNPAATVSGYTFVSGDCFLNKVVRSCTMHAWHQATVDASKLGGDTRDTAPRILGENTASPLPILVQDGPFLTKRHLSPIAQRRSGGCSRQPLAIDTHCGTLSTNEGNEGNGG
ncbi:hypothetical protein PR003_g20493 [Phytophthora rubi]|uniref:Uncharacterized protein n=1 Tax=Phytophthora rubi TaxID=129364 RepID=A0A6A3K1P1_9STRA|nr:hypothetical protein PR002_g19783 [Phytophthora rubi]KAE8998605.1 hypothetical protein PR001_g19283 [Phytophthora rubi]KAE9309513.1 hypothetical protein PR003_g20493 [Phytophthora rubi]